MILGCQLKPDGCQHPEWRFSGTWKGNRTPSLQRATRNKRPSPGRLVREPDSGRYPQFEPHDRRALSAVSCGGRFLLAGSQTYPNVECQVQGIPRAVGAILAIGFPREGPCHLVHTLRARGSYDTNKGSILRTESPDALLTLD